jgi:hypothetical protein
MTDARDPWEKFFKVKWCPRCDPEEASLIKETEFDCGEHQTCAVCGTDATVYAMDTCAGGWGDYYCAAHTPQGWIIEEVNQ